MIWCDFSKRKIFLAVCPFLHSKHFFFEGVVHLNLSVAHVIRGESDKARLNLDKAEELFTGGGIGNGGSGVGGSAAGTPGFSTVTSSTTSSSGSSLPAHFLQARIYLDLLEGDRDRMQSLLKAHFGHVTGNASAPDTNTQLKHALSRMNIFF